MSDHSETYKNALRASISRLVAGLQIWWQYPNSKLDAMTIAELEELNEVLGHQYDNKFRR